MNNNLIVQAEQYVQAGRFEEASRLCTKVLKKRARDAGANYLLGTIMLLRKNYEKSEGLFIKCLSVNPRHADANNNLGIVYLECYKNYKLAEEQFKKAIICDPSHLNATNNLGNVYLKLGELELAERSYRKSLELNPKSALALHNLGNLLVRKQEYEEASCCLWQAIHYWPENQESYIKLGDALLGIGDMAQCKTLMEKIMTLSSPGIALFVVYSVAKKLCQWDVIEKIRGEVLTLIFNKKSISLTLQTIVMELLADYGISNATLLKIHKAAASDIDKLREAPPFDSHDKAMRPASRMRIGYLSADFRGHVANHYIRGLINRHDRGRFEVYCYSNTPKEDNITEQYKAKADVFIDIRRMTDLQLAKKIHDDGIHILVDLGGYTRDGRIHVMSYRPAPIQITYMGYPYSSGMPTIDYIISDPYLDGPVNAGYCSEIPLRLPESFVSFGNLYEQEINPTLPFERNRHVTFGTLVNTYKVNPEVIRVWSEILKKVPSARLILNHPNCATEATRENILKEFSKNGITQERLEFIWDKHPCGIHLAYYNDIDIALDAFPMTGGQTTVDAVWMGVPVVTLVGDTHHQRLSYSILNNIGIVVGDLSGFTEEEYIEKAAALANRPERIKELHRLIPGALKQSILCDPAKFVGQLETAYIEIWDKRFPDHAFQTKAEQERHEFVSLRSGVEIAVPNAPDDFVGYVLKEQRAWFDPEYDFVCNSLQPGMRALDINAGPGVYAIPLAKKIAKEGKLWAVIISTLDARLLAKGMDRNQIDNLHIIEQDREKIEFDKKAAELEIKDIDFVRLNVSSEAQVDLVVSGKRFFSDNSPLVMFGVKNGNDRDLILMPMFKELGYDIYRFIPGLDALVPFTSADELDVFALNLFCCKPDRAHQLMQRDVLVCQIQPLAGLPTIHEAYWQEYIGVLPYAKDLIPGWLNSYVHVQEWEVYHVALNLFALAKNSEADDVHGSTNVAGGRMPGATAAHRYACLQTCFSLLVMLNQANPSLPRLLSLARVMIEMGKREQAVNLLNQLIEFFQADTVVHVDEPFLALSSDFAAMNPEDKLGDWIVASVIGQRELLRALSTYFLGQESLEMLRVVQGTGFCSKELERRLQLLEIRYALVNETSSQVS